MRRYAEYDPEVLRKIQLIETDMLKDFNELCERHNIDYFGVAGSAIGAMRHKAFIPWDDDIDIGFTRENYEKFLKVAEEEYSHKYDVVNTRRYPKYPLMTTRWVKKGTVFKEESLKDIDVDLGIFLDLYSFDNIPDDDKKMKKQFKRAWFWGKLLILRSIKRPVLYMDGIKQKLAYFACAVAHYGMKLFRISPQFIYKQAEKWATKYNNEPSKRLAYFHDTDLYTSIIERKCIEKTVWKDFEDTKIKLPGDVHQFLYQRYGDYMQLPPEDKRHNHPPYYLDLGEDNK